ncbi:TrbI/VirB10 family protein (plasmid) [Pseudomonas putida]|uniref:TrbI/VirB10 family protein n=1 Tax=Pseudomonas putida TaxID=303 RepID=A0A7D6A504_PSEPU|nr:TrbI/VirB10 family protein [Pseudomonas putida]QLJ17419.1 TrbI/VirB10 family protein [Pseudomonas putida]
MAEESAPRVDERPATYKRKMQVWLAAAVGVVMALLLVLTVLNVMNKMKEKKAAQEAPPPPAAAPKVDRQDQFSQLVSNRKPSRQAVTDPAGGEGGVSLEEQFDKLKSQVPGLPGSKGASKTGAQDSDADLSPEDKAMRQWRAREQIRALDSARAKWGLDQAAARTSAGKSQAPAPRAQASQQGDGVGDQNGDLMARIAHLNRPFDESKSLEERRAEVKKRIDEAQRLRASLAMGGGNSAVGAGMAAGGVPGGAPQMQMASARQELKQVSSGFSAPPPNVVGYTKDNKYNADIAGKIKLNTGTEILTTLTKKAISDYSNSSLKAIVNRDVYDIERRYVVIPKGTEITIGILRTRNVNEAISNRMAFLVKKGILPNGNEIDFSKSASAADREGVGAIEDQTDYHLMAQFFGVAAYALVGTSTSRSGTGDDQSSYAGDVGEGAREQTAPLAQKYLNIVPTQTIRPGQSFQIVLESEMYIEPWSDLYAKYVE